jgi:hypothetical protein
MEWFYRQVSVESVRASASGYGARNLHAALAARPRSALTRSHPKPLPIADPIGPDRGGWRNRFCGKLPVSLCRRS